MSSISNTPNRTTRSISISLHRHTTRREAEPASCHDFRIKTGTSSIINDNNNNINSTMKIVFSTVLIAGLAAAASAMDDVWSRDGDCQWLYQTVGSSSLQFATNDPHLICATNTRRRRLKGSGDPNHYNHFDFSDECGCLHTDDNYACVEENSAHEVVIRQCSTSIPMAEEQTWMVVPLTFGSNDNMVLFENRESRRCITRVWDSDYSYYKLVTATCSITDQNQMFREPSAGSFFDFE